MSDNGSVTHFFLQEAGNGSYGTDDSGNSTLTLTGVKPDTIYFTDRPSHEIGFVPMEQFLEGFDWNPINPPNAVLIIQENVGNEAIIGLELTDPKYDGDLDLLTYHARPLDEAEFESNWISGLKLSENQPLPENFGQVSLLIDDCPCTSVGTSSCDTRCRNSCYDYKKAWCEPCGGCCAEKDCQCTSPSPLC